MEGELVISIFALAIGIFNTICLMINFFLSKAPTLEYKILESRRNNEIGFFLRNIGVIKGKLEELVFYSSERDSLSMGGVEQILFPGQRTRQNFYYDYTQVCNQKGGRYIKLSFRATVILKILGIKKKYHFTRDFTLECN